MTESAAPDSVRPTLQTPAGDFPLREARLHVAGRDWTVAYTGAVVTVEEEAQFLREEKDRRLPYGVTLWPAAIALAHEIASRPDAFQGTSVLELGAGTGLPGIIAASFGARVLQTDRHELALAVCQHNGTLNAVRAVDYRLADWSQWEEPAQYDWILGSDILYADSLHPHLRHIFENNLARGGRILLSDPFRRASLALLEPLEAAGWNITLNRWTVGDAQSPRPIGLYELSRP